MFMLMSEYNASYVKNLNTESECLYITNVLLDDVIDLYYDIIYDIFEYAAIYSSDHNHMGRVLMYCLIFAKNNQALLDKINKEITPQNNYFIKKTP